MASIINKVKSQLFSIIYQLTQIYLMHNLISPIIALQVAKLLIVSQR